MRTILKAVLKVNIPKRKWTPTKKLTRRGIAMQTDTGWVLVITSIIIW